PIEVKRSYRLINSFLINFYKELGLDAKFFEDISCLGVMKSPFCFLGKERLDIVIGGKKIGGNAQRRAGRVIFQHGCIPMDLDFREIENLIKGVDYYKLCQQVTSLNKLLPQPKSFEYLQDKFIKVFLKTFNIKGKINSWHNEEIGCLDYILNNKYNRDYVKV
ncbi:MAG: hypothetical protein NC820_03310, partial [Candidatus Omnitrophica bacterium]|nr:hypothetical protein [Candidatus Omnitrophota bacterium]